MSHIIFTFRSAGGSISSLCPSYNVTDCSHTGQEKHILLFKTHIQLLRWGLTSERTCPLFFPWRSAPSLWTQLRLSPSWDYPGTRSSPALSTWPGSSRCSSRFKWGGSMSTTNLSPLCRSIIKMRCHHPFTIHQLCPLRQPSAPNNFPWETRAVQ